MAKTIFEQMGGTYTIQGDYYLPDSDRTTQRKTSYRRVGASPQTVSKAAP